MLSSENLFLKPEVFILLLENFSPPSITGTISTNLICEFNKTQYQIGILVGILLQNVGCYQASKMSKRDRFRQVLAHNSREFWGH